MASELKVDKIFNAGGDQDSGINLATNDTIKFDIATSTKATMASTGIVTIVGEGGSTTTNLQQGLCKCWVQTPSGGTAADSFNVSGMTDNSTGNYTVAIANNMANDDYSVTISKIVGGSNRDANAESVATSNFIIVSTAASAMEDQTCFGTIHGDLA